MFQGINAIDFAKRFHTNETCFLYLSELKWKNGFSSLRCGHTKSYKGAGLIITEDASDANMMKALQLTLYFTSLKYRC